MISLVAFDLDGTLAASKQPLEDTMGEALADLLQVAHVAVISGGDWEQFEKQVASRLPARANLSKLWLLPTTGTKLYKFQDGEWHRICADLFSDTDRDQILEAFRLSLEKTGFKPEKTWGPCIEDRGSQITFSALGHMSINMGGATSIDVTRKGVDKGYGLKRLSGQSGIPLKQMMFIGDAIFPGGNDYPALELGLDTVKVKNPDGTLAAIAGIVACLRD
ncbi:HAD-like protein [Rhypophila sp. PSN 637]